MIIEATDKRTMRSGVSGLVIAFAKRLNQEILARRTGKVWGDRYHAHELVTPREVRNALAYVYHNYKKHGYVTYGAGVVDPCRRRSCSTSGRARPLDADRPTPARHAADVAAR